MLTDLVTLTQLGSRPNLDGIEEEFSRIMGKPRGKLFQKGALSPELASSAQGGPIRTPAQNVQAGGQSGGGVPLPAV